MKRYCMRYKSCSELSFIANQVGRHKGLKDQINRLTDMKTEVTLSQIN